MSEGILAALPIGEKEKRPSPKCEGCGLYYEDTEGTFDWAWIDECGQCVDCCQVRRD